MTLVFKQTKVFSFWMLVNFGDIKRKPLFLTVTYPAPSCRGFTAEPSGSGGTLLQRGWKAVSAQLCWLCGSCLEKSICLQQQPGHWDGTSMTVRGRKERWRKQMRISKGIKRMQFLLTALRHQQEVCLYTPGSLPLKDLPTRLPHWVHRHPQSPKC